MACVGGLCVWVACVGVLAVRLSGRDLAVSDSRRDLAGEKMGNGKMRNGWGGVWYVYVCMVCVIR